MLIPKIYPLKQPSNLENSIKITRRPILKKIIKIKKESTKDSLDNKEKKNPKTYQIKRIKVLYRPLNPQNKFNSLMTVEEIVKKDNAALISNDKIRELITKFRKERDKENLGKKIFYKEKSYQDIQKEKNTNFLMIRAMLRRDPVTIQSIMRRNKNNNKENEGINQNKKLIKSSSMKTLIKYQRNNWNKSALLSNKENLTSEKNNINNNNNSSSILTNTNNHTNHTNKILDLKKKKFSKKEIWKKDFLAKIEEIKKNFIKKYEAKIKSAYSLMLGGHLAINKISLYPNKKFNQDCTFCYWNLLSLKLDEISLFGIIDGSGPYGKAVALAFKNYIVNYFKNGNEMKVTQKKDNFYSIIYNSFNHAQNYLKENSAKLNINLNYSGATGIIVLFPHNNTNKVYCANVGRNKCVFYTMSGAIRLSYELFPLRASERFRIAHFKEQQKLQKQNIEKNNKNEKNNNVNNDINEEKEKEKEFYLKQFFELDISRCIGYTAAEEYGVIPGPEIMESDIRLNKGKILVIGTESLWKYLDEDEVGEIVNKHYSANNTEGACKDLQDLAKERWKEKNGGGYDDISVIVVFFDSKSL